MINYALPWDNREIHIGKYIERSVEALLYFEQMKRINGQAHQYLMDRHTNSD